MVGVAVPTLTYYFTRKKEIEADWRKRKLEHYNELLSAISDVAIDNNSRDAHLRMAQAFNTVGLAAPQYVIDAFLAFWDGISNSKGHILKEEHDLLLSQFIRAIRRDIGILPIDEPKTFAFRLLGGPPPSIQDNNK
ncbi:hypothetical protein LLG46_06710 [bacterium]|nr:hypothetical protein [bacterium]